MTVPYLVCSGPDYATKSSFAMVIETYVSPGLVNWTGDGHIGETVAEDVTVHVGNSSI